MFPSWTPESAEIRGDYVVGEINGWFTCVQVGIAAVQMDEKRVLFFFVIDNLIEYVVFGVGKSQVLAA